MAWLRVQSWIVGAVVGGLALTACATRTSEPTTRGSLPPATAISATETAKPSAAASSVPPSEPDGTEPFDALSAIAFPSATDGVLLTVHCDAGSMRCAVDTFASANGGRTWSAPTVVAEFTRTPDANPYATIASKLTFVDTTTGYAYGPDLFRTRDGGRSWQRLAVSGSVENVVQVGDHTWVVRSPCPPGSDDEKDCGSVVDVLDGDSLTPLAAQPAPSGAVTQLVAASPQTVYSTVLIGETFGLRMSADHGSHWAPLPLPCSPAQATGVPVSLATAGQRLWMVCSGGMGAGAERKQLFTSDDGGHTWHQPGDLEIDGYADQVVAISATTAWRFGGRALAYVTTDGGRTWTPRLPDVFNGAFGPPNGWAFVGAEHLWLLDPIGGYTSDPHHLYVTDDGGSSWRTITLPRPR